MERDDDIDYTIAGLLILEQQGFDFTTKQMGGFWTRELPYGKVYTAEKITYRNLAIGIPVEQAGEFMNPCREWIGSLTWTAVIFGLSSSSLRRRTI